MARLGKHYYMIGSYSKKFRFGSQQR